MADNSAIEWTEATWSPVTGCTKISDGCMNCYIERTPPFRMARRRFDAPGIGGTTDVKLHSERLPTPLSWRKPRRIFVCSLADLFHEAVPDRFIADVFAVMSLAKQHTFQVLTKRHARMRALLNSGEFWLLVNAARLARGVSVLQGGGPVLLPNVWVGVSVESHKWAAIRIPALLDTPAAVRWLSCEPLLGPVDLSQWLPRPFERQQGGYWLYGPGCDVYGNGKRWGAGQAIGWVVAGGESGPGARPMYPDWARSLRDQCTAAGVPYFFKQWGSWVEADRTTATHLLQVDGALVDRKNATVDNPYGQGSGLAQDLVDRGHQGWVRVRRVSKKAAGRELDGRTWDEMPSQPAEAVAR